MAAFWPIARVLANPRDAALAIRATPVQSCPAMTFNRAQYEA